MEKYLFLFILYSFVGWIWETSLVSTRNKKFVNRGFLKGPYIPIYGFACLTIILSMGLFKLLPDYGFLTIVLQILYMGIVTAVWEYFTSLLLEKMFKTRWWDYSNLKFNIAGRIAPSVTAFFALGSFALWRFVNPLFESLYNLTPSNIMLAFLISFYALFVADNINTFKDLFKFRGIMDILQDAKKDIIQFKDSSSEKLKKSINEKFEQIQTKLKNSKNLSRLYKKYQTTKPAKVYESWLENFNKTKEKSIKKIKEIINK